MMRWKTYLNITCVSLALIGCEDKADAGNVEVEKAESKTDSPDTNAVFLEGGSPSEIASLSLKLDDFEKLRNKLKFGVTNDEILEGANNVDFALSSFVRKNGNILNEKFKQDIKSFSETLVNSLNAKGRLDLVKAKWAGDNIMDTGELYILGIQSNPAKLNEKPTMRFFRERLGDSNFLPWLTSNCSELVEARITYKGQQKSKIFDLTTATLAEIGKLPDKRLDDEDASAYFNAEFLNLVNEPNFSSIEVSLLYKDSSPLLGVIFKQLEALRVSYKLYN